jgi:hypothetical protein
VRGIAAVALIVLFGMWTYSHVAPTHFGECKEVAVTIGVDPTVRDCRAYAPADFAVPFATLIVLLLLVGSEGSDIEISLPFAGTFKRTGKGREAASLLREELQREEGPSLDQRTEAYLEGLGSIVAGTDEEVKQ